MKTCKKCGLSKQTSEFYINKLFTDGLTSKCKICLRKEALIRFRKNFIPQKCNYCKDPKDRIYGQYCSICAKWLTKAKHRAWAKNQWKSNKEYKERKLKEVHSYYSRNREKILLQKKEYVKRKRLDLIKSFYGTTSGTTRRTVKEQLGRVVETMAV